MPVRRAVLQNHEHVRGPLFSSEQSQDLVRAYGILDEEQPHAPIAYLYGLRPAKSGNGGTKPPRYGLSTEIKVPCRRDRGERIVRVIESRHAQTRVHVLVRQGDSELDAGKAAQQPWSRAQRAPVAASRT